MYAFQIHVCEIWPRKPKRNRGIPLTYILPEALCSINTKQKTSNFDNKIKILYSKFHNSGPFRPLLEIKFPKFVNGTSITH